MRVVYLISLLMTIKVASQDLKFNDNRLNSKIENQIELLNLNESQKIKFRELNDIYRTKLEMIKYTGKAKFEKFQDLKYVIEERDIQIKLLLNKDQFKLYKKVQRKDIGEIRKEFRKRFHEYPELSNFDLEF